MLVALVVLSAPGPLVFSAGNEEVLLITQVRVARLDIWLHADGVAWQHTGSPGDQRIYAFDVTPPEIDGYTGL